MSNRKSLEHLERACQEASMPSPSVSSKRHFLRIQRKHSLEFCLLILKGIPHISIMVLRDGGSNLGWTSLINHPDPIPSTCQKGSSSSIIISKQASLLFLLYACATRTPSQIQEFLFVFLSQWRTHRTFFSQMFHFSWDHMHNPLDKQLQ